ncbi:hypothetical protein PanWU01x14_206090, partial [Parasponia andersonii]
MYFRYISKRIHDLEMRFSCNTLCNVSLVSYHRHDEALDGRNCLAAQGFTITRMHNNILHTELSQADSWFSAFKFARFHCYLLSFTFTFTYSVKRRQLCNREGKLKVRGNFCRLIKPNA